MLRPCEALAFLFAPPIVLALIYRPFFGRRVGCVLLCVVSAAVLQAVILKSLHCLTGNRFELPLAGFTYLQSQIAPILAAVSSVTIVLLHSTLSLGEVIPFASPTGDRTWDELIQEARETGVLAPSTVRTLRRRPGKGAFWAGVFAVGAQLLMESFGLSNALGMGAKGFSPGCLLCLLAAGTGTIQYVGAGLSTRRDYACWLLGTAWLFGFNDIASRGGLWTWSNRMKLDGCTWLEPAVLSCFLSYIATAATALFAHVHTLLILVPDLPPCPPRNPVKHLRLVLRCVLDPPEVDARLISSLLTAGDGVDFSGGNIVNFNLVRRAFPRELVIPIIAVYAWRSVTRDLLDKPDPSIPAEDLAARRRRTLAAIQLHLVQAYEPESTALERVFTLTTIPGLSGHDHSAFYLFAALVPRLAPIYPFLEMCRAYSVDIGFGPPGQLAHCLTQPRPNLSKHLPVTNHSHLEFYAYAVMGSLSESVCYLAWSVLDSEGTRPSDDMQWSAAIHPAVSRRVLQPGAPLPTLVRAHTVAKSRDIGRAIQYIAVSRDIAKDAAKGRLFVPLCSFKSPRELLQTLIPGPEHAPPSHVVLGLLDQAESFRVGTDMGINGLPRAARGGARALVACAFQVIGDIRRNGGQVDMRGCCSCKWRHSVAAAKGLWL